MAAPPTVLLVTGSLRPGGTEIAVFRTALGLLARERFRPEVAVLAEQRMRHDRETHRAGVA